MAVVARIWQPGQDVMVDEPEVCPVNEPADSPRWAQGQAQTVLHDYLDSLDEVRAGTWRLEVWDEDSSTSPACAFTDI